MRGGGRGCTPVNGKQETARRVGQMAAGKLAQRAWVPHPSAKWDLGMTIVDGPNQALVGVGAGQGGCGGRPGGDMSTNISKLARQAAAPIPAA